MTKHPTPLLDKDSATELKACGLVKFWILNICLLVYGLFIYPVISPKLENTIRARLFGSSHFECITPDYDTKAIKLVSVIHLA